MIKLIMIMIKAWNAGAAAEASPGDATSAKEPARAAYM